MENLDIQGMLQLLLTQLRKSELYSPTFCIKIDFWTERSTNIHTALCRGISVDVEFDEGLRRPLIRQHYIFQSKICKKW